MTNFVTENSQAQSGTNAEEEEEIFSWILKALRMTISSKLLRITSFVLPSARTSFLSSQNKYFAKRNFKYCIWIFCKI